MNRKKTLSCLLAAFLLTGLTAADAANVTDKCNPSNQRDMEKLELTSEWDKVFPRSDKVNHSKVIFHNRYGITLVADLYVPKQATGKLAAIAVSGPFGAVKEQSSGLYAQMLAERGFLTLAFDPSFTGESGGQPRYVASPDINTEDFCAAVDYLSTRDDVDPERIGILGICGWGGMALNAAAIDTRIKATVTSTMYDMSRVSANGYFDSVDVDRRYELRRQLNAQRTADYRNGSYERAGGVVDPLPADAPQFVKDYYDGRLPQRLLRTCRWCGGPAACRRTPVRKGLLRLLQDPARLSQAFAQLERRMEQDFFAVVHQHAHPDL